MLVSVLLEESLRGSLDLKVAPDIGCVMTIVLKSNRKSVERVVQWGQKRGEWRSASQKLP